MRKYGWITLLVLMLALSAIPVLAQTAEPPTDDQVNAIARDMYCPVCENIPLDVCGTQACAQWRELIREKLAAGWSEQQIRDYFAAQYGDRVLSEPPARGLNWLIYVLPTAGGVAGLGVLILVLWRFRKRSTNPDFTGGGPANPADDPYLASFEAELQKREGKD
jgi:cytochrome c-type biogenesis protein CcmH